MFDFVISQNQRSRPTRRVYASYVTSILIHCFILLTLYVYPQLLQGGMYHRFRPLALLVRGLSPDADKEDEKWRTVVVLTPQSKMMAPSAATLKKYIYDWSKKGAIKELPPIRIRFGAEQKAALNESAPPMPKVKQEPKAPQLSMPANELAAAVPAGSLSGQSQNGPIRDDSASAAGLRDESGGGKKDAVILPPPSPAGKSDAASNAAPTSIPKGIQQPPNPPQASGFKVFEDEQKAIRSNDSGFFDTKGFPLGEYANLIKERIKGNWMIPSNLQNFQGHTTLIFYIDKNGRYADARIVTRSGNNSFDNAALMAVIESDPFPPLPKGFPGNHIGAKFVLSWNEP
jgi:TonB family protein